MPKVQIVPERLNAFIQTLKSIKIPPAQEDATHEKKWEGDLDELANCYLAIVAICHQTSPVGERRLQGRINGIAKSGWDYLKEKYLEVAMVNRELSRPRYWRIMTPERLSDVYNDKEFGQTLNRINERSYLLNNLGEELMASSAERVGQVFRSHNRRFLGGKGFQKWLSKTVAYSDPVMKKSLFFMSIVMTDCGWEIVDSEPLSSPVDYHELRGHLRIGTVEILDDELKTKVLNGMVVTKTEDVELRSAVQEAIDTTSKELAIGANDLHYLFWNIFRTCCPRESSATHCSSCGDRCELPPKYQGMLSQQDRCVFSNCCDSANAASKLIDPPILGHYY